MIRGQTRPVLHRWQILSRHGLLLAPILEMCLLGRAELVSVWRRQHSMTLVRGLGFSLTSISASQVVAEDTPVPALGGAPRTICVKLFMGVVRTCLLFFLRPLPLRSPLMRVREFPLQVAFGPHIQGLTDLPPLNVESPVAVAISDTAIPPCAITTSHVIFLFLEFPNGDLSEVA